MVADSVGATQIINTSFSLGPPGLYVGFGDSIPSVFSFSDDGSRFALVVRRGNLDTGLNEWSALVFQSREVLDFVNSSGKHPMPVARTITRFATSEASVFEHTAGIDQLRWLPDGRRIAFIGRRQDGLGQVFVSDVVTGATEQVTHYPGNVVGFSLAKSGGLIIAAYSSPPAAQWTKRNESGYTVGDHEFSWIPSWRVGETDANRLAEYNVCYFAADQANGDVLALNVAPARQTYAPELFTPFSGAAATAAFDVSKVPARWADYDFIANIRDVRKSSDGNFLESADPSTNMLSLANVKQFQIVDLHTGSVKPLLDAPSSPTELQIGKRYALWSPDSTRVLLASTYLPLDGVASEERFRRTHLRVVAVVTPATGIVEVVTGAEGRTAADGSRMRLADVQWLQNGDIETRFVSGNDALRSIVEIYRHGKSGWVKASMHHASNPPPGGAQSGFLQLRIEQALNSPPEVAARDLRTGHDRVITRLNPQLQNVELGDETVFTWSDKWGRTFRGGLIEPKNGGSGTHHAVVLQAGNFNPDVFSFEGPSEVRAPYAARALASHGITVLQMPNLNATQAENRFRRRIGLSMPSTDETNAIRIDGSRFEVGGDGPLFVAGVESAIDALDTAGIIDRSRVGLLGFSVNGMRAQYDVTFSKYPVAAAIVADAFILSPYFYSLQYGRAGGMAQWDVVPKADDGSSSFAGRLLIGAPLWGAGVAAWTSRSYLFHLDQVHTPVRYEEHGDHVPLHWEAYAILKRLNRPVEMFDVPLASHNLEAPQAIAASEQGTVDWFRFWLLHEEDPDPAKMAQYERWRQLRAQAEDLPPDLYRMGAEPESYRP